MLKTVYRGKVSTRFLNTLFCFTIVSVWNTKRAIVLMVKISEVLGLSSALSVESINSGTNNNQAPHDSDHIRYISEHKKPQ